MERENDLLKQLLQSDDEERSAPMVFTSNVMESIEKKHAWKKKPIIGKIGWLLISFSVVIISVLSISTDLKPIKLPFNIGDFNFLYYIDKTAVPLIGFLILLSFILLDNFYRKRKKKLST